MRQMRTSGNTRKAVWVGLSTVVLFCLIAPACGNTCFIFVSNPSGGTIAVGTSTCKLSTANGTISVQLTASLLPTTAQSPSIQHIFITLRGIQSHPSTTAEDDSADWQELVPILKQQPLQVDLMERNDDSRSANLVRETVIPAGTYRQLRMLLVPDEPALDGPLPEKNDCGRTGFNCIIFTNGAIRSLVLDEGRPQIPITSEQINGGFFQVLPSSNTKLAIEFSPRSSMALPMGQAMHFNPVFTVSSEFSIDPSDLSVSGAPGESWSGHWSR